MNLLKFLKEVDTAAKSKNLEELTGFIHDLARLLPEYERVDFLNRLIGIKEEVCTEKLDRDKEILQPCERIKEKFNSIEEEELCIESSYNPQYNEWYDSEEEELIYYDPDGVGEVINEACAFVHRCVDWEEYKVGYEIADMLLRLRITIAGEFGEEYFLIGDLPGHGLCEFDYERFVMDAMYAAYRGNALPERADALFTVIMNCGRSDITLEMVMQNAEELPEVDKFLELWIAYLGNSTSLKAQKFMAEALGMIDRPELFLENARKFSAGHPALYEQYLIDNLDKEDGEKLLEIGKEALAAVDTKYIVRSRIALLTSEIALKCKNKPEAENSWLEAFRSDTRVVNYLRLLMECVEFSKIRDEATDIYHDMYTKVGKKSRITDGELKENLAGAASVYMLAFLGGEFQYVRDTAMQVKESLGWSSTFMKCGLAAFLLLLIDAEHLLQGGREMCSIITAAVDFDKEEYQKGTQRTIDASSRDWFWQCFCRWKSTVSISDGEKQNILKWVEELVAKRVDGIMGKSHRNYYNECAGFAAALGEARESLGESDGKQKTLLEYKKLYSRRSAFHGELREYGMADR